MSNFKIIIIVVLTMGFTNCTTKLLSDISDYDATKTTICMTDNQVDSMRGEFYDLQDSVSLELRDMEKTRIGAEIKCVQDEYYKERK